MEEMPKSVLLKKKFAKRVSCVGLGRILSTEILEEAHDC